MASRKIIDSNDNELWVDTQGRLHREDGPAGIFKDKDETIQIWMQEGKRHREDGPALEITDETGAVVVEQFFITGDFVSPTNFKNALEKLRMLKLRKTSVMAALLEVPNEKQKSKKRNHRK